MISNVYLSKYDVGDTRLVKRLLNRGFKLVGIFVALNVLRDCLVPILSTGTLPPNPLDPESLLAIFLTGNFTGKLVVFYILLPIAYLLIVSGTLMFPLRVSKYVVHVVSVCLFALVWMLDVSGRNNPNLDMVAIGALGILAGFSPLAEVNKLARHPYALAVSYLLYTVAIAIWNVPYPLTVVGTVLSVTIIYLVGTIDVKATWIRDEIILLGKYSLFGYISQIVILQSLSVSLRHFNLSGTAALISFPAAFALTVIAVEVVHRARSRATRVDMLYKAVFN